MQLKIVSLDKIEIVADEFIQQILDSKFENEKQKCIAFYGSMGVGKTTFIKALCKKLGVEQIVNSPTFAIINQYNTIENKIIYHFDFYRLNKPEEAFDFGYEDYFYSGNICLIEWPEKIEELLPETTIKIYITEANNSERILSTKK